MGRLKKERESRQNREEGWSDPECRYHADISMNILVYQIGDGPTVCVDWVIDAYETAECTRFTCEETNGWESEPPYQFKGGPRDRRGTATPGATAGTGWSFSAELEKCCGECEINEFIRLEPDFREYFNEGTACGGGGPLAKQIPAPIDQLIGGLNSAPGRDGRQYGSLASERELMTEMMVDWMNSANAKEGWGEDPAKKDCQEIQGYCAGNSI